MEKLVGLFADARALREALQGTRIDSAAYKALGALEGRVKTAARFWGEDNALEAGVACLRAIALTAIRGEAFDAAVADIDGACQRTALDNAARKNAEYAKRRDAEGLAATNALLADDRLWGPTPTATQPRREWASRQHPRASFSPAEWRALQVECAKAGWLNEGDHFASLWDLDLLFQSVPTRGVLRDAALKAGLDVPYGPLDTPMRGNDVLLFRKSLETALGIKRQPLPKTKHTPVMLTGKGVARGKGARKVYPVGVFPGHRYVVENHHVIAETPDREKWEHEVVLSVRLSHKLEEERRVETVSHRVKSMGGRASRAQVQAQAKIEKFSFLGGSNFLKDIGTNVLPMSAANVAPKRDGTIKAGPRKGQKQRLITDRRGAKTRGVKSKGGQKH